MSRIRLQTKKVKNQNGIMFSQIKNVSTLLHYQPSGADGALATTNTHHKAMQAITNLHHRTK